MESTHLNTSGGHLELTCEFLSEGSVGLCVVFEDIFEDFELSAGCSFAVLDLVGLIWVECPHVDVSRVDSRRNERRDTSRRRQ